MQANVRAPPYDHQQPSLLHVMVAAPAKQQSPHSAGQPGFDERIDSNHT